MSNKQMEPREDGVRLAISFVVGLAFGWVIGVLPAKYLGAWVTELEISRLLELIARGGTQILFALIGGGVALQIARKRGRGAARLHDVERRAESRRRRLESPRTHQAFNLILVVGLGVILYFLYTIFRDLGAPR